MVKYFHYFRHRHFKYQMLKMVNGWMKKFIISQDFHQRHWKRQKTYVHIYLLIFERLKVVHVSKMSSIDIFFFLLKYTLHQKKEIKCVLKVILLGVNHTEYEPCIGNVGSKTEKDALERDHNSIYFWWDCIQTSSKKVSSKKILWTLYDEKKP